MGRTTISNRDFVRDDYLSGKVGTGKVLRNRGIKPAPGAGGHKGRRNVGPKTYGEMYQKHEKVPAQEALEESPVLVQVEMERQAESIAAVLQAYFPEGLTVSAASAFCMPENLAGKELTPEYLLYEFEALPIQHVRKIASAVLSHKHGNTLHVIADNKAL